MAQSLSKLLVHIIFSTKGRRPLITPEIEPRLHQYLTVVCESLESPLIFSGGMPDHVHLLVSLSPKIAVSDFLSKIKANSSRWVKKIDPKNSFDFSWQGGYGAFSLGESSQQTAIKYIANQKKHHKKISFQEEFVHLLQKYNMPYDEKYLWE